MKNSEQTMRGAMVFIDCFAMRSEPAKRSHAATHAVIFMQPEPCRA